jgi:hypothetical protein
MTNSLPLHNGVSIINWTHYENKAKAMTDAQLLFVIRDCTSAIEAQRGIEGIRNDRGIKYSGFYEDERHTYSDELRRRRNKKR